jgi:hypothetical protein
MNAKERAEKIADALRLSPDMTTTITYIAAQIEEDGILEYKRGYSDAESAHRRLRQENRASILGESPKE